MSRELKPQENGRPREDLGRFVGALRITRADGRIEDVQIEIPITPAMLELASPEPHEAR